MDENEIKTEAEAANTIKVVVSGKMNKNVTYKEGMTHLQVLKAAGIELDSLEYGSIAIDGENVINKEDLSKEVKKEQQIVSVAPKAANGE